MQIKKVLLFAAAGISLASCGLYNKYERPEVNTQGLVRDPVSLTDTLAVADTTSFGNLPWRTVFTDPQLQTLIQQGQERRPAQCRAQREDAASPARGGQARLPA